MTELLEATSDDDALQVQRGFIVDRYFSEFEKMQPCPGQGKSGTQFLGSVPGACVRYGGGKIFRFRESVKADLAIQVPSSRRPDMEDTEEDDMGCCEYRALASSRGPVDDLVLLPGPLTEHVVLQTLQSHFFNGKYQTKLGSVLLSLNPFGAPTPLRSLQPKNETQEFISLVRNVTDILWDTGVSQVIILNGASGSGKTHNSHILLRTLFQEAGDSCQTDSFKYLSAALTVIRAFGSASTANNPSSNRLGYFFENSMSEGTIHRTKIRCHLADPYRVCSAKGREGNFHIFYLMLSSLSTEERDKYNLKGYNVNNLAYLSSCEALANDDTTSARFSTWKACLGVLGVPLPDILRILSAILLLGNVTFVHGDGLDLVVQGERELALVGSLLGIPVPSLYRAFTQQTKKIAGRVFRANCDLHSANRTKDNLAAALYCRTLLALVKRANSTRSLKTTSTASSSSNDSFLSEGNERNSSSSFHGSRTSINHVMTTPKSNEFIGVLDMFGFEDIDENGLCQLCINLCSEALQHLYNTHVFKASEEACIEEGVQSDMDVYYFENAPLVEMISSQRTGILSILEDEGRLQSPSTNAFLHKIRVTLKKSEFFEESSIGTNFTVKHFAGKVDYNAKDFLSSNRESVPDNLVAIFSKCSFGFASHLFSAEIKLLRDNQGVCNGRTFPVMPHALSYEDNQSTTLSSDFHARLDALLKILVQARPHFIRCIRANTDCKKDVFDTTCVLRQIRSLQVLETLHITATGFPHRLRYRAFNNRYKLLLTSKINNNNTLKQHDDMKPFAISKLILEVFLQIKEDSLPFATAHWGLGKKHIFLSEIGHQELEEVRREMRIKASTLIQSKWRCYLCASRWPLLKAQLMKAKHTLSTCSHSSVSNQLNKSSSSCGSQWLDLNMPPPLPATRAYSVCGEMKIKFPQKRKMKQNYTDPGNIMLLRGHEVMVIGQSSLPGHLLVSYHGAVLHVPHRVTEMIVEDSSNLRRALSSPHLTDLC